MQNWILNEVASLDLNDKRLNERYKKILSKLSDSPNMSFPQSFTNHAELTGAYRFLNNHKVDYDAISQAHKGATLERIKNEEVILAVQDTTSFDYSNKKVATDLGYIENSKKRGLFLHPTLLFNESGVCFGTYASEIWTRDLKDLGKAQNRKTTKIEAKESYRWIKSYEHACRISELYPDKTVISVGDRESDIYELFDKCLTTTNRADIVIRAGQNRRTKTENNDVLLLRDQLEQQKVNAELKAVIPSTPKRAKREAVLEIKYASLEFLVPAPKKKNFSNVSLNVVNIKEKPNETVMDPIEWVLLTTLEITSLEDALRVLEIYKRRWQIEIFFRTLKTGCKVEELSLQTKDRLIPSILIYSIIAFRIMHLCMFSRVNPKNPAKDFFMADEIEIIRIISNLENDNLTLNEAVRIIATWGGFLGRKCDKEPGPKHIWTGMKRLVDYLFLFNKIKKKKDV